MFICVAQKKSYFTAKNFWFTFYNRLAVPAMSFVFQLIAQLPSQSRRVEKIRQGVSGRTNLFAELTEQLQRCAPGPRVWIHASSMGECEQARPILRELHQRFPQVVRVLTLFSPSAYANLARQNLPVEVLCYLPFDSLSNVCHFFDLVKPAAGLIIRHDLWPNFLWEAKRRGIPLLLADAGVSANTNSLRHKFGVRHFNRELFANFAWVCAVSPAAAENLRSLLRHPDRLLTLGDTRYDQVLFRTRARNLQNLLPEAWQTRTHIFVAGSTWPSDEEIVIPAFAAACQRLPEAKMILVPHEPTPEHLSGAEQVLNEYRLTNCRLSQIASAPATQVLLIDRVGVLAELYGAAQVAFVGGSFGPGVHSVLEAAAHGIPVLFGPRMRNSTEALEMEQIGIGRVIQTMEEGAGILESLFIDSARAGEWGKQCRAFVESKAGASQEIVKLLDHTFSG